MQIRSLLTWNVISSFPFSSSSSSSSSSCPYPSSPTKKHRFLLHQACDISVGNFQGKKFASRKVYKIWMSVHLLLHWSVGPSVPKDRVKKCGNAHLWCCSHECLSLWVSMGWERVWMGVVCPCPPVCNGIVTLRRFICLWGFVWMSAYLTVFLSVFNPVCLSVCQSVRQSTSITGCVRWSVGWSVGWSGNTFVRRSTCRTLLAYLALLFYT